MESHDVASIINLSGTASSDCVKPVLLSFTETPDTFNVAPSGPALTSMSPAVAVTSYVA